MFDLFELRANSSEVLDDCQDLSTSGVELVFQLFNSIRRLLLSLDLGSLMKFPRRLFASFDSGKSSLVDFVDGVTLQLLLFGRVDLEHLFLAKSINRSGDLVSFLFLRLDLLTELLLIISHLLVETPVLKYDLVTLVFVRLLNQLLSFHKKLLHLPLLFFLDLKLLLELLLFFLLNGELSNLVSFAFALFGFSFLHFVHLLFGFLLSLLLSDLGSLGLFDSSFELSLLFGFLNKNLLALFFELETTLFLIKFFLNHLVF